MTVMTNQNGSQRHAGLGSQFHRLWAASAVSNLGDGVVLVAAPLLAASLTRDPALVAGLMVAQRLPWLIFPLLSGALADRIDRQKAMANVALLRATLIGMLGAALLLDLATIQLLYVVFFLLSTGETLFDTASATVLPAIVPKQDLPRANARLSGTWTIANAFVGPPLGGLLFGVALALPFLLGAGGLVVSAILVASLRGTFTPQRAVLAEGEPRSTLREEISEGVRWLWGQRLLRTLAVVLAVLNLALVAQVSVMVLVAEDRLGLGATGYGLLLTSHAAGAVLGSLVAHRVIARIGRSRVLRLGLFIEAGTPALIALASGPILAGVALAIFGFHALVWGALLTSLRQELTPDRLRGRVESVYRLLEYGTAAPGAFIGGLLASRISLAAPFWFNAIIAVVLIPFVWPVFSERSVAMNSRDADSIVN